MTSNRFLRSIRLPRTLVLLFAASLALSACGDDATGPSSNSHLGTYTLVTVNGKPLPATLFLVGDSQIDLLDGSLALSADNTYTASLTTRVTEGSTTTTTTQTSSGTYVRTDNALTFTESANSGGTGTEPGTISGTLSGDELTLSESGATFVFRK